MPRPKKAEVEAVMALLDQPADDVETLAKMVIATIDKTRALNPCFMVAVKEGDGQMFWGPFWTLNEAERAIGKTVHTLTKGGSLAIVLRVIRPKDDDLLNSVMSKSTRKRGTVEQ
jgi:hypothetical protein